MSFQQGLSGLNATSKNLEVIGNNIANANTFGAKSSRAEFADVYAAALNGAGRSPVGIGVNLQAVAQQFTQGNISTTENPLDLAINGNGFFQVSDGLNPAMYTRNGQFKLNREGFIVNNQGQRLMGYPADGAGVIQPGTAVALQLPTGGVEPAATTEVTMEANLDSRTPVTLPTAGPQVVFDDPRTYNNATSHTIFDQMGNEVALTYYFQKVDTDSWNLYVTANGTTIGGDATNPLPVTTIEFPATGGRAIAPPPTFTFDVPASTNSLGATTLPINGIELDLANTTLYGSPFGVTNLTQDGYAAGQLSGITIEPSGIIMAAYSNGQTQPAGQLELALFRNPQGLAPNGNNSWSRTFGSGDPIVGVPGQGNMGVLQAGALEESNVDLTGELVSMIMAQRIYQANAQTIKAQDAVLQTLVNLR
jgi:flagellar hook protein FlgE